MLQPKILDLEPIKPYRLRLYYETEEIKIFDVEPYIKGAWYGELRNSAYFNAVRITGNGFGVEWPNGQDVAPHELYDESVNCPT